MKASVRLSAYLTLIKPRIMIMVLVTTTWGYFLGGEGIASFGALSYLLFGAGAVCAGSAVLNNYLERTVDGKMERTRHRPLPTGTITAADALSFGVLLVLGGLVILFSKTNLLTAFLSLLTAFLYVIVYTPLKRVSWLNTTVGAIPGAIPPLGGWTAATGQLDLGGWILFLILFIWQHPHFYAIAWMFREDYQRGGFKMLPVIEPDGRRTFAQIFWYSVILIPVSILPTLIGMSGYVYMIGALLGGGLLLRGGCHLGMSKTTQDARRLLRATVMYLPFLLCLIILDAKF